MSAVLGTGGEDLGQDFGRVSVGQSLHRPHVGLVQAVPRGVGVAGPFHLPVGERRRHVPPNRVGEQVALVHGVDHLGRDQHRHGGSLDHVSLEIGGEGIREVGAERRLELLQVLDRVGPLPLRALPLVHRDVPIARQAGPVGLDEFALQRIADRLLGGVGVWLAVARTVLIPVCGLPGQGPLGRLIACPVTALFHCASRRSKEWWLQGSSTGVSSAIRPKDPWFVRSHPPDLGYHVGVLDKRDEAILVALQRNATFAEIGKEVGLSPSSVHERVRKLEHAGVIRGYRAELDAQALGLFVTALVSVMPLDPTQPDDLPQRVLELSEVEDCHSVAGDENYILKVRTRTTAELEDFLRRLREKAGVQTRTTVVLSTPFEHRPIPR